MYRCDCTLAAIHEIRRVALAEEFAGWDMEIRPDSKFCDDFIHGQTRAAKDEVAAVVASTTWLFERGGYDLWSIVHDEYEGRLRALKYTMNLNWKESFRRVKEEKDLLDIVQRICDANRCIH